MWKLDTKGGIICSGILSIVFAILHFALNDDYLLKQRTGLFDLGVHISTLQILGSLCLLIGALRHNYKYFIPWMFTTVMFLYLMVYLTLVTLIRNEDCVFLPLVVPFTAYLGCALCAVQRASDGMRKDEPLSYAHLVEKKVFISHI
ncbi:hypothetical protein KR018_010809 [Drosophila ironensis]|nr:hypothetical protein KR018_010809 [Drosophila ironensis]